MRSFHWILNGRLAGSGRPGLLDDLDTDLEWLRAAGIRHLVTLTEQPFPVDAKYGFESHHFPIEDMGAPTPRRARTLCVSVTEWLGRGEPVLLHCKAGLGRTGTILACCLVSMGHTDDEAVDHMRRINPYYIQSDVQRKFICHYAEFVDSQT